MEKMHFFFVSCSEESGERGEREWQAPVISSGLLLLLLLLLLQSSTVDLVCATVNRLFPAWSYQCHHHHHATLHNTKTVLVTSTTTIKITRKKKGNFFEFVFLFCSFIGIPPITPSLSLSFFPLFKTVSVSFICVCGPQVPLDVNREAQHAPRSLT